jgi:hypothetical protein
LPLPRPVQYFSQYRGPDGPAVDDAAGCWYACAKMIGVYYEGTFFRSRKAVPELTNPNGTHQSLAGAGQHFQTFQINEKLIPINPSTPMNTASDVDAALTAYGPIMFTWWAPSSNGTTFHASVIVGIMDRYVVFHDPDMGASQTMSPEALQDARSGGDGIRYPMLVRNSKFIPEKQVDVIAPRGIVYASDSYTKR